MELNKICKVCLETKLKTDFGGKSAKCKKCLYIKNKDYFKEYYQKNSDNMKSRQSEIYHIRHDHLDKKKCGRKRIDIKPIVVNIPNKICMDLVIPNKICMDLVIPDKVI